MQLDGARVLDITDEPLGLPGATREGDGEFDVIVCGELERELHPQRLLEWIRARLAPGGTLVVGSLILTDPELSEHARFARGEGGIWWLPGRLCLRRQVEAAGLRIVAESPTLAGPDDLVRGYLSAQAV